MSESPLDDLVARLHGCMPSDRHRLERRLRRTRPRHFSAGPAPQFRPEVFEPSIVRDIEEAEHRIARRRASVPPISFDSALPISAHVEQIAGALMAHQVVVVCGETGCGKTTQLPKICLQLGRGVMGMIGHTQPRRIAARSVAARIASELQTDLGDVVGYTVRFADRANPHTLVRLMTDGILLAEIVSDRTLLRYDTIILDEAHDRSLNIDFLLGYLKHLLPSRPDLKVIVTSATIDPGRFSKHFDAAPVIEVRGRGFPVHIRHQPVDGLSEMDDDAPVMLDAIAREVTWVAHEAPGDVLVFLSGELEIKEAAKHLRGSLPPDVEILPLYARLSAAEQGRIFEPHRARRVVLATNVAETSLTVPGITAVIDPGLARISRYSASSRIQRLPIEPISQASASQRAGRCGRVAPGVCVRLYSAEDLASRPLYTDPEILRSNLASVVLRMKALRLGRIEEFPFLDKPRASAIREGLQTLHELAALDAADNLTATGHELARMPLDPRLGRMILSARDENALREVLVIVAALAVQDPRLRPAGASNAADGAHAEFLDSRSDFLTFVNLWNWWQARAAEVSSNRLRRLCESRWLSYVRMREWVDVHRQLHASAVSAGMHSNTQPARYAPVHRAILAGLLGNVGLRDDAHEYQGLSDRRFVIHPGSAVFRSPPRWIMAAEIVETRRLYARTVARIQPEWIEDLAGHMVKRVHSPPRWNARTAHVEADERVLLRGLTVIPRRRVHYAQIDVPLARETFIQHALVEGDYRRAPSPRATDSLHEDSIEANRRLIATLSVTEHKRRRRDVIAGPEDIFAFYDARVPADVCNGPSFEKWRRKIERQKPDILRMTRADVVRGGADEVPEELFPDMLDISPNFRLPLEYRHDPGHIDDGITLIVPSEALHQLPENRCDWLVPGMLREKIEALLRSLPKTWRVHFIPVPDHAAEVEAHLTFGVGVLTDSIARELDRSTGVRVPREAWSRATLPDHLRMNFRVISADGETLAQGRDLEALRAQVVASIVPEEASQTEGLVAHGATHWIFDEIPERVSLRRSDIELSRHPALVDEGCTVGLSLFDSAEAAARSHRSGVRRLFVLRVHDELTMHVEYLPALDIMCLHHASLGDVESLKRDLVDLIADRVFLRDDPIIRTESAFERRVEMGWDQLGTTTTAVASLVAQILAAFHDVEVRLTGLGDNVFLEPAALDLRQQLGSLLAPRFLVETPWRWLTEFPRYLRAAKVRVERLSNAGLARDRQSMSVAADFWNRWRERRVRVAAAGRFEPRLEEFRWLVEELRVALFAPGVPTSVRMSRERLERTWNSLHD